MRYTVVITSRPIIYFVLSINYTVKAFASKSYDFHYSNYHYSSVYAKSLHASLKIFCARE